MYWMGEEMLSYALTVRLCRCLTPAIVESIWRLGCGDGKDIHPRSPHLGLKARKATGSSAAWWRCGRVRRDQEVVSQLSLELAEYFILWTSIKKLRAAEVLELYRLRWQIELVFKRMKSILSLGHLPKKDLLSAQAWLEGKLFVGLLIERMADAVASFFPWGYPVAADGGRSSLCIAK